VIPQEPIVPSEATVKEGTVEHTVQVTTVKPSSRTYVVWRRKPTYFIIGSLIVAVILMFVAFWRSTSENTQTNQNLTESLELVSRQLDDAKKQIEVSRSESAQRETCRLRYSANISERNAQVIIGFAQAVTIPATDEVNRQHQREVISQAGVDLQAAIDARTEYEASGAPLPCPI